MPEELKKTSKDIMNEILSDVYTDAFKAKEEGRPVCWATGIAPQELLETMGIDVVYPENHSASMGAKKTSMQAIERAEQAGYSSDICSYARCNFGYIMNNYHTEGTNMPAPDFVLCCTNTCYLVAKWYENLAKELNIPILYLDTPYNYDAGGVQPHMISYMTEQVKHIMKQLEEITGRPFDKNRFEEVMEISRDTAEWWIKATDVAQAKPSPLNGFEMFNYMGIMVCARGKEKTRDLFRTWYHEMMDKVAKGEGPWKDQKEVYRVQWDGIACWPYLSTTYKLLKKLGINVVASSYPKAWDLRYSAPTIEEMVKGYSGILFMNRDIDYDANAALEVVRKFDVDGIIYHSNRSCKAYDFRQYEIQRRIKKETGVPAVFFDGDQTDPRGFATAQFETRIQALVEMMEARKARRG